jgi:hypothetical protein
MDPLTITILGLFGLFWLAEIIAHVTKYKYGSTLSALVWKFERWSRGHGFIFGLWPRILIGLLCALLFTHLEFQIP